MITIDFLKYHPECIASLANIWHEVLGKIWLPDVPIARVEDNLHNHLNSEQLPLTFVAFHNDKPVGMCSLRENDGIRPDLTPWLGSLVVSPPYQKQGIARILIDRIKAKAAEMDFKTLYLFAFDATIPDYYARLGWTTIAEDEFKGHPVTVMETMSTHR
ncbi:GNAT family N-acetyltransferase [Legionella lansingensis]|nr:GNAT family N-acetyltransferase [Legionella lansingensis]